MHINISKFTGLSRDWVGAKNVCVFWGHSLWGRKHINKIRPKSRDNPVNISFMCFFSLCFFRSQMNFRGITRKSGIMQARKRNPNPNFLVRISSDGMGVFRVKGWGPKSSVCPSKHRETKLFGGISRDLWRDIRGCPTSLRKKTFVFNFRTLITRENSWGITFCMERTRKNDFPVSPRKIDSRICGNQLPEKYLGRPPEGGYSPRNRSRHLLENPFSEPLLRTLSYCKTIADPLLRTLLRTLERYDPLGVHPNIPGEWILTWLPDFLVINHRKNCLRN